MLGNRVCSSSLPPLLSGAEALAHTIQPTVA